MGVLTRRHPVMVRSRSDIPRRRAGPLVTSGLVGEPLVRGLGAPLFVITIAAAETVVALAIISTLFRHRRRIDLDDGSEAVAPCSSW